MHCINISNWVILSRTTRNRHRQFTFIFVICQALTIGEESKSQVRLLGNLDEDVEAATGILEVNIVAWYYVVLNYLHLLYFIYHIILYHITIYFIISNYTLYCNHVMNPLRVHIIGCTILYFIKLNKEINTHHISFVWFWLFNLRIHLFYSRIERRILFKDFVKRCALLLSFYFWISHSFSKLKFIFWFCIYFCFGFSWFISHLLFIWIDLYYYLQNYLLIKKIF